MTGLTRRRALGGAATVGLGLPLLDACVTTKVEPVAAGTPLVKAGEVPVGGGVVLADDHVVVSQPVRGEFKAFSNICTHMSCGITTLKGDLLVCPCHGSEFSVKDGSVVRGPATQPLASVPVIRRGDEIEKG